MSRYLFHGSPGSGKTTLGRYSSPRLYRLWPIDTSHGTRQQAPTRDLRDQPISARVGATQFSRPAVIRLTRLRMDDAKLGKLFRDCPAKSIILIEDMWVFQDLPNRRHYIISYHAPALISSHDVIFYCAENTAIASSLRVGAVTS